MATQPKQDQKKSSKLNYGEGQREQYGEGYSNRPEDVAEGAKSSTDKEWAGGDHDEQKTAPTDKTPGDVPAKKKPTP